MSVTCRCGAQIQDDWKFCYACSGPLPTEEERERQALAAVLGAPAAGTDAGGAARQDPAEPRRTPTVTAIRPSPEAVMSSTLPAKAPRAQADPVNTVARAVYVGMLVASVWLMGLAFGMPLPGPDGSALPDPLRLPALITSGALFVLPEAAAWPLARTVLRRPPEWAEARRSASMRTRRLFAVRISAVLGALVVLLVTGIYL